MTAAEIKALLKLEAHPEGGWYRETFRDTVEIDGRPASTAILFLLDVGEVSEWHRVDAAEAWHWHAGAPLVITISPNGHDASAHYLGPDLAAHQRPQFVVPAGHWQTATSLGALDAGRLHRRTGLPFRGLRTGTSGVATCAAEIGTELPSADVSILLAVDKQKPLHGNLCPGRGAVGAYGAGLHLRAPRRKPRRREHLPIALTLRTKGVPFFFGTGYGEIIGMPHSLEQTELVSKPYSRQSVRAALQRVSAATTSLRTRSHDERATDASPLAAGYLRDRAVSSIERRRT